MPASGRPAYTGPLAQALGVSADALIGEWARYAAEARARAVRDGLRRLASEWVRRPDRGSLGDHLDGASRPGRRLRRSLGTRGGRR